MEFHVFQSFLPSFWRIFYGPSISVQEIANCLLIVLVANGRARVNSLLM
ncbi:MAG: hypothetical protein Ct9H300mP15_00550 [Gemmatimonadota bacterium]|nr:MAG: hypothetical protein Ct9H300mP15_00550 [Gemmatimonadota bacterium]